MNQKLQTIFLPTLSLRLRISLALGILLFLVCSSSAQNIYVIRGRVTNDLGQPLVGVRTELVGLNCESCVDGLTESNFTRPDGRFILSSVGSPRQYFVFSEEPIPVGVWKPIKFPDVGLKDLNRYRGKEIKRISRRNEISLGDIRATIQYQIVELDFEQVSSYEKYSLCDLTFQIFSRENKAVTDVIHLPEKSSSVANIVKAAFPIDEWVMSVHYGKKFLGSFRIGRDSRVTWTQK